MTDTLVRAASTQLGAAGGSTNHRSSKARGLFARLVRIALLWLAAAFFGLPLVWLLLAPTKSAESFLDMAPLSFGSLANVGQAWENLTWYQDGVIHTWILNTIYYSVCSVVLSLALAIPAGYGLAKYGFIGRRAILTLTLIGMIVPTAALVLPLYMEMNMLRLLGTPASVILPMSLFPFGVYLAYLHFLTGMPESLLEAARIDGASEASIFFRIALPLAKPAIGLIGFLSFVGSWNNYFLPYVMLSDDRSYNLQIGLQALLTGSGGVSPFGQTNDLPIHQPETALAALITIAPVMLVFLFSQRLLVAGQLAGSEKG